MTIVILDGDDKYRMKQHLNSVITRRFGTTVIRLKSPRKMWVSIELTYWTVLRGMTMAKHPKRLLLYTSTTPSSRHIFFPNQMLPVQAEG